MSILLSLEQQSELHHRYLNDDLFRHWSLILSRLERQNKEVNPVSVWYETERLIQTLHDAGEYSDAEIPLMFTKLIVSHGDVVAITLMTVLFTRLANTAKSAEASDENQHKPLCIAILREISHEPLFETLIKMFESQKLDNKGNKVFIQSTDPMDSEASQNAMDEIAKEEKEKILNKVYELTRGLSAVFKKGHWEIWKSIWDNICNDSELMTLLKKKNSPRGSQWPLNEKLIRNVLGIFLDSFEYSNCDSTANNALGEVNRRDNITNHSYKSGSSTELKTKELHEKVENIIKSKKSS